MSPEQAEFYRELLREEHARHGLLGDDAIVRLAAELIDKPPHSNHPTSVAFNGITMLLFGDPSRLSQLLQTLVDHPEVLSSKPYSAFKRALPAVLPLSDDLENPATALGWHRRHGHALRWDPTRGVYEVDESE